MVNNKNRIGEITIEDIRDYLKETTNLTDINSFATNLYDYLVIESKGFPLGICSTVWIDTKSIIRVEPIKRCTPQVCSIYPKIRAENMDTVAEEIILNLNTIVHHDNESILYIDNQ